MKSDFILLMIYILEGIILGITAFVIRKKHSAFPDFTAEYHVKEAEKDRESWDYANETAGKLCGTVRHLRLCGFGGGHILLCNGCWL